MNDSQPPNRDHWYSLESPTPIQPVEAPPPRTGRARKRRDYRQQSAGQPVTLTIPRPKPLHLVMAGVTLVIVAFIAFVLGLAGQRSGTITLLPTPSRVPTRALTQTALPLIEVKPWTGKGRVTVLVMGLDARPGETLRNARSDTLLLISIDPDSKTAGMLSIPRDLYLPIPGEEEMQKINAAYVLGELRKPGSGPLMAMQTLQYNLGIKINSYIALDFSSVIALVDAVGGIDVEVPYTIDDADYPDMNFGYERLYIQAGRQHLDGVLALKYVRTRHQTSDFDRTKRQQQVILALRDKATRLDLMPDLLRKAPTLWTDLSADLLTDLSFDQLLSLASLAREVPLEKFQRGTIEGDYMRAAPNLPDQAVTLRREKIADLMTRLFGANYGR